jgi:hypothetical protein
MGHLSIDDAWEAMTDDIKYTCRTLKFLAPVIFSVFCWFIFHVAVGVTSLFMWYIEDAVILALLFAFVVSCVVSYFYLYTAEERVIFFWVTALLIILF